jgi:hypothetical protein
MSAQQYRDRADALIGLADGLLDDHLVRELEATAADWRKLAALSDAQDAMVAALANTRG